MRAGNQLAAQSLGTFGGWSRAGGRELAFGFETIVFPECDAVARRDAVFPPSELKFVVVVVDEEDGGGGAIVGRVGGIRFREVGKVL